MQAPQLPADNRSSAGFTLIEILVAFTVATLLLGALYQLFSAGLRSSASAQHYADAVLLAESGLDALVGTAVPRRRTTHRFCNFERRNHNPARPPPGASGAQRAGAPP